MEYKDKKEKEEVERKNKKEKEKEIEKKMMDLEAINNDIMVVEKKIDCADNMVEEGNKLLKACATKMNLTIFFTSTTKN